MPVKFKVETDKNQNIIFKTNAKGNELLRTPLLNKGTAYSKKERIDFGLDGLVPPRILPIEKQIDIINDRYQRLGSPFEILKISMNFNEAKLANVKRNLDITRFNFLRDLQDRNEILYYAFCNRYLNKVLPIIYTPTVGEAVRRYSRNTAKFRGIFLSPDNIDSVSKIFENFRFDKPTIAVITDNQGILGIGDQGVGGIDIPIGKLSLYVLGAGIRPWETMPITLDVGTDNKKDLKDPYYLGYKTGRLMGDAYDRFIEKFINGIKEKFPNILIQWEDFSRQNAFSILDKYRYDVLSFNDDIQGTGSVALAGVLSACKLSEKSLKDQKFVIFGAGAGGVGIARRIEACLEDKYSLSETQARKKIAIIDSRGLVTDLRKVADYKKHFSKNKKVFSNWEIKDEKNITLNEVIKNFKATVLIGTSGVSGAFTTNIINEMKKNTERPIIFPLSNPTINSEATPNQILKQTNGSAIVATGSPFKPVKINGKKTIIGQGNNFFIFPGVGFGAILSHGHHISDNVFTEAAIVLSELTKRENLENGCVYPDISNIREISARIALKTTDLISEEQNTKQYSLDDIKSKMWVPRYCPIEGF
jgi:malate dehydrogenase (oxaloacetate-decarboxylating)/malate dehydrogenase (oxaloacetate-decarboxylating)(NADP+)